MENKEHSIVPKKMKVLVACEESQEVCKAFRKLGHEAYSCDILPCSGGHPEWHIQDDVLRHLSDGWDLMIAHPPCTYLSYAGIRWFKGNSERYEKMVSAMEFFMKLYNAPIEKVSVENPLGFPCKLFRSPNQVINPFQFGHPERKRTCLWLKTLPMLKPTMEVTPEKPISIDSTTGHKRYFTDGTHRNPKLRSKTFPGIAKAMAEQWGANDK